MLFSTYFLQLRRWLTRERSQSDTCETANYFILIILIINLKTKFSCLTGECVFFAIYSKWQCPASKINNRNRNFWVTFWVIYCWRLDCHCVLPATNTSGLFILDPTNRIVRTTSLVRHYTLLYARTCDTFDACDATDWFEYKQPFRGTLCWGVSVCTTISLYLTLR